MNLVLTFDYELFGDGSGDVFKQMIEPTEEILKICNENGIKTTIFVEVMEYLRIKEEWNRGNRMGYGGNPVEAIKNQIRQAASDGHDIQLHIHPQWVNAEFGEGSWNVDLSNWRIGDFKSESGYGIEELVADGKRALEDLVRPADPGYKCMAFRAGAFNIMPSNEVYAALKSVNMKVDSSVYPGGYEEGELSIYDYRDVSVAKDFWWADPHDIRKEAPEIRDIMEVPIFALPKRRVHKLLNMDKIRSLLRKRGQAVSSVAKTKFTNQTFLEKVRFLLQKEAFTWDFCLFSKRLHEAFFHKIERHYSDHRTTFVLIGHPKSYRSGTSLRALINLARSRGEIYSFRTLKEVYEEFSS